jgi:hypothetical protein
MVEATTHAGLDVHRQSISVATREFDLGLALAGGALLALAAGLAVSRLYRCRRGGGARRVESRASGHQQRPVSQTVVTVDRLRPWPR